MHRIRVSNRLRTISDEIEIDENVISQRKSMEYYLGYIISIVLIYG